MISFGHSSGTPPPPLTERKKGISNNEDEPGALEMISSAKYSRDGEIKCSCHSERMWPLQEIMMNVQWSHHHRSQSAQDCR